MLRTTFIAALTLGATAPFAPLRAQTPPASELRIEASVDRIAVETGQRTPFSARVLDGRGGEVDVPLRIVGPRSAVEIEEGWITGLTPGDHEIFVTAVLPAGAGEPPSLTVPVTVTWPAVDVSGELMGNLYTQGREIAVFKSASPAGYTPNATMVWGTMPHKGQVFFSDTNSGIWSVRLVPRTRPIS